MIGNILAKIFFIVAMATMLQSCTNYRKLTYFNNVSDSSHVYQQGVELAAASFEPVAIKVDDILSILVSTSDPENRMTDAINQVSIPQARGAGAAGGQAFNANTQGLLVDKAGNIELPMLGIINVEGKSTSAVAELVRDKAGRFFKNPTVNVRLLNFRVTVLGEVTRPGTYTFSNERVSVLDAIGLAGDLTVYGRRNNVMVIRDGVAKKDAARLNLNDARALMSSPHFYLKQNDVVYIEPVRNRAVQSDATTTRTVSIVTGAVSVLAVILSFIINK